ncbi:MAG TPA: peptidylprolyl isomerase [Vicinamibacterales bacterium]|nr:peptidylprolyl isomerase [Vicinamibacterales bacterium]
MLKARPGAAAALIILLCAAPGCRKPPSADGKTATPASGQPASGQATPGQPAPGQPASSSPASGQPGAEPAAQKPPEPPKPVPATIPAVVARVNGENVPKAEFDRLLKQMEMQAGQAVPKERRDEIYRAVIDQLVTYTALVHESRARAITVTDAEAKQVSDARIAELRKQIPDPKAFNKALAERNMTLERLRADIRRDIAISKMMEAELATAPAVTDAEIKDFYDKNPDQFSGVRASHILIRPEGFDEASKKKARSAIDDVLRQAKGGGDFAELARKHSSDGSAQQGGDLGFFTKGSMVPEFSKAAFALQPGQISDVVETQFGFHIIKVAERKDIPITEATEKIRQFLTEKRRDERQQAFVAQIKGKSKIEVLF